MDKKESRRLMATYEYRCQICNIEMDVERSMFEEAIDPQCCGIAMRRTYSSPTVKFNGSGFYSTDNANPRS